MSHNIGSISEHLGSAADLLGPVGFLIGMGLGAVAIFRFKGYAETGSENALSSAVGLVAMASSLMLFSSLVGSSADPEPIASQPEPVAVVHEAAPAPAVAPPGAIDQAETGRREEVRWTTERAIK